MPILDHLGQERTELILSWLFPVTYLIHITEEYWAGVALSTSPSRIRGANLTPRQFLVFNGIALMLMFLGTVLSRRLKFRQSLVVILGLVVTVNGIFHLIGTMKTSAYNPGLVSGVLIWTPLGLIAVIAMKKRMLPKRYWIALTMGIAINGVVLLLARFGRGLFEGLD